MIPTNARHALSMVTNFSDMDIQPLDAISLRTETPSSAASLIPFSPQATLFMTITALIPILMVIAARTWATHRA